MSLDRREEENLLYRLLLEHSEEEISLFIESISTGIKRIFEIDGIGIAFRVDKIEELYKIQYIHDLPEDFLGSEYRHLHDNTIHFLQNSVMVKDYILKNNSDYLSIRDEYQDTAVLLFQKRNHPNPDMTGFINYFAAYLNKKKCKPLEKCIEYELARYRDFFWNTSSALMFVDTGGTLTEVNPSARLLLGYAEKAEGRDDIIGISFTQIVHGDDTKKIGALFSDMYSRLRLMKQQKLAQGASIPDLMIAAREEGLGPVDIRVVTAEGYKRDISLFVRPRINQEGRIAGSFCTLADTSELHITRKSLKENEEKYKILFETAPVFSMLLDREGNIIEVNNNVVEKYGYSSYEKRINFKDFVYEEDIEHSIGLFIDLYNSAHVLSTSWEWERLKLDEEYRTMCYRDLIHLSIRDEHIRIYDQERNHVYNVEFSARLVVDKESLDIKGTIITAVDVTQRKMLENRLKESEEKYREIFKYAPIFSVLADMEGYAIELNYKALESYGLYNSQARMRYSDFVYDEDRHKVFVLFTDMYREASNIRKLWENEKRISREECYRLLRDVGIKNEPIRLVSRDGMRIFESEFNASLWIRESDLTIQGALVTSLDVTERNRLKRELEESEKKYRGLVEEKIRDIIFTLDSAARFVTVNKNIMDKLGFSQSALIGKEISNIIYEGIKDRDRINRSTFMENINKVLTEGMVDVRFKALCKHNFLGEAVALQFKLDPVFSEGVVSGVMGFASEISDDPLREYLKIENVVYEIDNRLTTVDEMSYRITRDLQKYFDQEKVGLVRLGLREIIINAIEHGNLEISYEEKTQSQAENTFNTLIKARQSEAANLGKRVRIEFWLGEEKAWYKIKDSGTGFDYQKLLQKTLLDINSQQLLHGRGILMAKEIFDGIQYMGNGNEVILTVLLKKRN